MLLKYSLSLFPLERDIYVSTIILYDKNKHTKNEMKTYVKHKITHTLQTN